jgi:hypothetical protein
MPTYPFSFFPVVQDLLDHWFSPSVIYNFAGNAGIEKQVVENVASYGRQIGWLNEVVLELAEGKEPEKATVARMRKAVKQINMIKDIRATNALDDAKDALARLEKEAPERYHRLLNDLAAQPAGAPALEPGSASGASPERPGTTA